MNRTAFLRKLHTEKSVIIQQYQPTYPAVYNIVVDQKGLDNIAHVLYQDGRTLTLPGEKYGIDFRKIERSELNSTVSKILSAMESAQQEKLWHTLGLDSYQRLNSIQGMQCPYFVMSHNSGGYFSYGPLAPEKFAYIIPDSFGLFKTGVDNRYFGAYDNDLKSTLDDDFHLDNAKIASALCDYEPAVVWKYEESRVLKKLDRMTRETNVRPYIFSQTGGETIVGLPEEAQDYLSPSETELAEKLIVLQESAGGATEQTGTEDPVPQLTEDTSSEEELPAEESGPQMAL